MIMIVRVSGYSFFNAFSAADSFLADAKTLSPAIRYLRTRLNPSAISRPVPVIKTFCPIYTSYKELPGFRLYTGNRGAMKKNGYHILAL
jgi:hypothetical protein